MHIMNIYVIHIPILYTHSSDCSEHFIYRMHIIVIIYIILYTCSLCISYILNTTNNAVLCVCAHDDESLVRCEAMPIGVAARIRLCARSAHITLPARVCVCVCVYKIVRICTYILEKTHSRFVYTNFIKYIYKSERIASGGPNASITPGWFSYTIYINVRQDTFSPPVIYSFVLYILVESYIIVPMY